MLFGVFHSDLEFELSNILRPVDLSDASNQRLRRRLFTEREVVLYRRQSLGIYLIGIGLLAFSILLLRKVLR
jgi:hypothetical protein